MAKEIDKITDDGVVLVVDKDTNWRACAYLFSDDIGRYLDAQQIQEAKANASEEDLKKWEDISRKMMQPRQPTDPWPI